MTKLTREQQENKHKERVDRLINGRYSIFVKELRNSTSYRSEETISRNGYKEQTDYYHNITVTTTYPKEMNSTYYADINCDIGYKGMRNIVSIGYLDYMAIKTLLMQDRYEELMGEPLDIYKGTIE